MNRVTTRGTALFVLLLTTSPGIANEGPAPETRVAPDPNERQLPTAMHARMKERPYPCATLEAWARLGRLNGAMRP